MANFRIGLWDFTVGMLRLYSAIAIGFRDTVAWVVRSIEDAFPAAEALSNLDPVPISHPVAYRQGERPRFLAFRSRRVARSSEKRTGAPMSRAPAFAGAAFA